MLHKLYYAMNRSRKTKTKVKYQQLPSQDQRRTREFSQSASLAISKFLYFSLKVSFIIYVLAFFGLFSDTPAEQGLIREVVSDGVCEGEQIQMEIVVDDGQIKKYRQAQTHNELLQLPICIIATASTSQSLNTIRTSILSQTYQNFKVIYVSGNQSATLSDFKVHYLKNPQYTDFVMVMKKCNENDLILMVGDNLKKDSLFVLNRYHQTYNIWATYSYVDKKYTVQSFYRRVFDLIETNEGLNVESHSSIIGLSIIQLAQKYALRIQGHELFQQLIGGPFQFTQRICLPTHRTRPSPLFSLSQDHKIDLNQMQSAWNTFVQSLTSLDQTNKLKWQDSVQYQNLAYLPVNLSLTFREYQAYDHQYNLSHYGHKQLPFCITILAHNNAYNNQITKALHSVMIQNYSNYHIVLIDDASDDQTMEIAQKYMQQAAQKYMEGSIQIQYVLNPERKHQIKNSIESANFYCQSQQIQLVLAGHDRLIGRQVLQLFNAAYQVNPHISLVYTNHITSFYEQGFSQAFRPYDSRKKNIKNNNCIIGPTRTWKAKMMAQKPLIQFVQRRNLQEEWDIEFQNQILSTVDSKTAVYIPEVTYFYNLERLALGIDNSLNQ